MGGYRRMVAESLHLGKCVIDPEGSAVVEAILPSLREWFAGQLFLV